MNNINNVWALPPLSTFAVLPATVARRSSIGHTVRLRAYKVASDAARCWIHPSNGLRDCELYVSLLRRREVYLTFHPAFQTGGNLFQVVDLWFLELL